MSGVALQAENEMAVEHEQIRWATSLEQARQALGSAQKPILIVFDGSRACEACRAMRQVTLGDSRVVQFVNELSLPVRIETANCPALSAEYLVTWTPLSIVGDEKGRSHCRIEGWLPPIEYLGRLSVGVGRYWLNAGQFGRAVHRFREAARRHADSDAAAEALYWLGVALYRQHNDAAVLRSAWDELIAEHSESLWAKSAQWPEIHDLVEEASEESFPTSDSPCWTLGRDCPA